MESSVKSRNSTIGKFKQPTGNPMYNVKKPSEIKLSEEEKKTIMELKKIYLETIKLDVEMQRDIYNMEKNYEKKHNEIFDKRLKIIEDYKKRMPDKFGDTTNISNFWLKVLKSSYTEFISKRDEKILLYLIDIRTKLYNDSAVKFVIDFHFEANDFFTNKILTKTYYLNCLPDPEDPLSYDGAEIYKCEGCKIDWKTANPKKENMTSFFEFFSPPTLPDDPEDATYSDINAILQNDFELGFYLKERVIPKAIMFFTGEICDCQTSESEGEDTESNEDDDDDEEDDDEESDEGDDGDEK